MGSIYKLNSPNLLPKVRGLAETHATWKRQCIDVKPRPLSSAAALTHTHCMHASNFEPLLRLRCVSSCLSSGVNNRKAAEGQILCQCLHPCHVWLLIEQGDTAFGIWTGAAYLGSIATGEI